MPSSSRRLGRLGSHSIVCVALALLCSAALVFADAPAGSLSPVSAPSSQATAPGAPGVTSEFNDMTITHDRENWAKAPQPGAVAAAPGTTAAATVTDSEKVSEFNDMTITHDRENWAKAPGVAPSAASEVAHQVQLASVAAPLAAATAPAPAAAALAPQVASASASAPTNVASAATVPQAAAATTPQQAATAPQQAAAAPAVPSALTPLAAPQASATAPAPVAPSAAAAVPAPPQAQQATPVAAPTAQASAVAPAAAAAAAVPLALAPNNVVPTIPSAQQQQTPNALPSNTVPSAPAAASASAAVASPQAAEQQLAALSDSGAEAPSVNHRTANLGADAQDDSAAVNPAEFEAHVSSLAASAIAAGERAASQGLSLLPPMITPQPVGVSVPVAGYPHPKGAKAKRMAAMDEAELDDLLDM